ncbi:PTS system cellobiose-specific IIC component [Lactobacillus colini]|uniref:Permease IIC component n=1 Tax=Lactobacillus colini TaxID=1819254 RepID=A0ABS4MC09_9LACO|nr:PTS transporter subunit EIIC [Lactobacillus colini]MBP2057191.1 PTS system cellobiose-specific IIC component [Lactobacillus colini]
MKFTEKVNIIGQNINKNIYIHSISAGIMSMFPILIIGAFASLFSGLSIPTYQAFLKSSGLIVALNAIVSATTNMLGLWFTYGIAKTYADELNIKNNAVPVLALASYLILLPITTTTKIGNYLSYNYLGTNGMIVGMFVSILVVKLYKLIIDKHWTIKMPKGTPDYVSNSFTSLIPGFIVIIAVFIVRLLFNLTPFGNIFDCIYHLLQAPLSNIVGTNVFANVFITLLVQVSWVLGVHPGYLQSMTAPLMFQLDSVNQAAYAAHRVLPNINGMSFSYSMTIATFYPAIAMAILLFAKSGRLKTVGKVAVLPAFFGIAEPLLFGIPIVLNPLFAIPWIIAPCVNFIVGYAAVSIGLVSHYVGVTVFNVPMVFTGVLNGSFTIAILEVVVFIIDVLIFLPFIKSADITYLKQENKVDKKA